MMIFPLTLWGRIVLIAIAIILGIIFSMLAFPEFWKKIYAKEDVDDVLVQKKCREKK